mgnify:CR=1 FL=1
MKRFISAFIIGTLLTGCAPKIGSEEWCYDMKEKPKGDWTSNDAKSFASNCFFK